jgi:hypothetical protein
MDSQQNQQGIKTIYRMLLELINGILAYRKPLDGTCQFRYLNFRAFLEERKKLLVGQI